MRKYKICIFAGDMRFLCDNKIRIEDADASVKKWVTENLTLANPEYYKKEALGKWTGNLNEYIYLYEKVGNDYLIPHGCLKQAYKAFGTKAIFEPLYAPIRATNYESHISLYEYQQKASNEALRARNGVVVMPCGAGKTQTALDIIAQIGGRCLWLTHTADLLNQSMNRAKSVYDCAPNLFGTITGGKINIGEGITFATVQTMAKIDLTEFKNYWDIVVVDECHKAIGSPTKVMQFYKVLSALSCRYKFGFTATPKRSDGLEKSMFALLGDKIIEVSKEDVAHTTCPVKVNIFPTGYMPDIDVVLAGDGTINYTQLVFDLTHNQKRFDYVKDVITNLPKGAPVLVLANRVEYLVRLCEAYSGHGKCLCLSSLGNTKKAKEERKSALQMLNNGNIDCLFATYQLAKEGLDVPNLRYVVFATPEKDETTVIQSAGRVGRRADGKEYGTVIDFSDDFAMFKGWERKRLNYYKKLGAEVKEN